MTYQISIGQSNKIGVSYINIRKRIAFRVGKQKVAFLKGSVVVYLQLCFGAGKHGDYLARHIERIGFYSQLLWRLAPKQS